MAGIFDDLGGKVSGLFSEPTTAQMIGMQMLSNSGPSVGAPRNMFEGIPQAVMAGNQIERERVQRIADKASKEKRLQWLNSTRPDLAEQVAAGLDEDVAYKQATNDLFAKPELTTLQKNYNLAVEQGFDGTIMDYQTQLKKAGAATNTINMPGSKMGPISKDHMIVTDPETGAVSAQVIPGTPTDVDRQSEHRNAMAKSAQMLDSINNLRGDEQGLEETFGKVLGVYPQQMAPTAPGTAKANFATQLEQLQGQTFLEAYDSLKGGGQITEVEGKKAEAAIARLNTAQTREAFIKALDDLEKVVRDAMARRPGSASQVEGGAIDYSEYFKD